MTKTFFIPSSLEQMLARFERMTGQQLVEALAAIIEGAGVEFNAEEILAINSLNLVAQERKRRQTK
jgi:hypothetical protein